MAYIGASPSNGVRRKHTYTATASQTTFSGAGAEGVSLSYRDSNYVDVYVNGVKLGDADYTATSGTSIVLGVGAAVNDIVEIMAYDVFSVADTVSKADGGTFDGNVSFADNTKAIFGSSSDLEIFHDGSQSIIADVGTGDLQIRGADTALKNADGSESYILCSNNASVRIYYDNSKKLETTSTGIDVTGTAVTDGLTVAGNVSIDGGTIKLDGNYPVGSNNVALGNTAGDSIVSGGNFNTLIGANAGTAISTGDNNVAIGYDSLKSLTTGETNVAVGMSALAVNTANNNVGVGYQALFDNTSGSENTSMGRGALSNNTTASNNVAIGYASMNSNTTGTRNTVLGTQALQANTTANNNTAIGYQSAYSNTTGVENVAIGRISFYSNSTGQENTYVGSASGYDNSTGSYNVGIGRQALTNNTTATQNTAVGYQAGYSNQTGENNAFLGRFAGYSTTSGNNTLIGGNAGYLITTGANNTILGRFNGNQGGLDIRTNSNQIVLSDGDGNPRLRIDSSARIQTSQAYGNNSDGTFNITENLGARACISLRSNASGNTGNFVLFTSDNGSNAGEISHTGATSISYAATSDYRLKNNVTYTFDATTRLKQLKPARFSWTHDTTNTLIDGFLAHEVQSVVPEAVNRAKDAVKVWKDGEELPDGVSVGDNKLDEDGNTIPDYQTMDMSKMIPLLVKTIQELEARITTLEGE